MITHSKSTHTQKRVKVGVGKKNTRGNGGERG